MYQSNLVSTYRNITVTCYCYNTFCLWVTLFRDLLTQIFVLPGIWSINSSQLPTWDDITAVFFVHASSVRDYVLDISVYLIKELIIEKQKLLCLTMLACLASWKPIITA